MFYSGLVPSGMYLAEMFFYKKEPRQAWVTLAVAVERMGFFSYWG